VLPVVALEYGEKYRVYVWSTYITLSELCVFENVKAISEVLLEGAVCRLYGLHLHGIITQKHDPH
jgi:hypothetical protein